jgi:hypothetical protein
LLAAQAQFSQQIGTVGDTLRSHGEYQKSGLNQRRTAAVEKAKHRAQAAI